LRTYATDDQRSRMLDGFLLRDEEIYEMIGRALEAVPDREKCIIDGTPRSIPQADWLLDQVEQGKFTIDAVVHLSVDESVVRRRLISRGRSDDTDAGISKRLQEYYRSTQPILDYLESKKIPIYHINGDQEPTAVHEDILRTLTQ